MQWIKLNKKLKDYVKLVYYGMNDFSLKIYYLFQSVEVTNDLTTDVLSLGFTVIHDTVWCCKNDITEKSWWK